MSNQTARLLTPHVIGVDLGGTKLHVALAGADGEIIREAVVPTGERRGAYLVDHIATAVNELVESNGVGIGAVGVGAAGAFDASSGGFNLTSNLGDLAGTDFVARLEDAFGCPVGVDNDVNLAALGEWKHGHAVGFEQFVFIAVGTGLGMGIIANGNIVRGSHNAAGEIGFFPFGADPLDPANHRRGPLEEAVAGDTIAARYNAVTNSAVNTREVFDRATLGDAAAQAVIDAEAQLIARAIVSVNAVLDPSLVVLGGSIGSRGDFLSRLLPWLGKFGTPDLDVRTSLLGNSSTVYGALELARATITHDPLRY
ncbi:ROK family protein [Arthrobacter sp. NA-172]|uniref:ROK family protein n=1 Tax=Arthrobacter sp. NA-172 TaxID=3367524 RepID=UPI003754DD0D